MATAMTLDEAARWATKLAKPPKYAYKNSMRLIMGLIRSGKAKRGKYTIPISAKQAFQTHQSMGGKKMAPLAASTTRITTMIKGNRRRVVKGVEVDRNKPLYRPALSRGRGDRRRVFAKPVDKLFQMITKTGFIYKGGRHVEFVKGGAEPEMGFGGSGILPGVHHFGQAITIQIWDGQTKAEGAKAIKIPARPVLEATPKLADAAAQMMADECLEWIAKGYY